MQLPEYVSKEEVKRICKEMGLRDWTKITKPAVDDEEAGIILKIVNVISRLKSFAEGWRLSWNTEQCMKMLM